MLLSSVTEAFSAQKHALTPVIHWIRLCVVYIIVDLPKLLKKSSNLFKCGEQADLSKAENNGLAKFIRLLLKHYGGSNGQGTFRHQKGVC